MNNLQLDLLKLFGAILLAAVTYCLGRRTRKEQRTEDREEYHHRRHVEKANLHGNLELLSKASELEAAMTEKGQSLSSLNGLIEAANQIDKLLTADVDLAKLIAGLIDDQVQLLLEVCIVSEEHMQLADESDQGLDPYLLARLDLERMMLLLAVRLLDYEKPREWGYPRDPIGVLAQYTEFLDSQLEQDNLGQLAIEFSEHVAWDRAEMEQYVTKMLASLRGENEGEEPLAEST